MIPCRFLRFQSASVAANSVLLSSSSFFWDRNWIILRPLLHHWHSVDVPRVCKYPSVVPLPAFAFLVSFPLLIFKSLPFCFPYFAQRAFHLTVFRLLHSTHIHYSTLQISILKSRYGPRPNPPRAAPPRDVSAPTPRRAPPQPPAPTHSQPPGVRGG